MAEQFKETIENIDPKLLRLKELGTLQVNLGNLCNQSCWHCHIQASPKGENIMPKSVMQKIIDFLKKHPNLCIDITGGCPELNPDFEFFIENVSRYTDNIMVRTNLTVFFEEGLDWIPKWYRGHNIIIIASLPCYTKENVEAQRGENVFAKSIKALKLLNELGYGESGPELDLVYNPLGNSLPPPQPQLEAIYKERLYEKYGIKFNNLFTIVNVPIGRFKQHLEEASEFEGYLQLLKNNFTSQAAQNIMCRNLLSINYKGLVYNCDFNLAVDLPILDKNKKPVTIEALDDALQNGIDIMTLDHCFCCTAGAGSSCTGALIEKK